jgi:hypothetical protein
MGFGQISPPPLIFALHYHKYNTHQRARIGSDVVRLESGVLQQLLDVAPLELHV